MTKAKELLFKLHENEEEIDIDPEGKIPDKDDIVLTPSGRLGSKISLSAEGKYVGEFDSEEEAEKAIVIWINKNKYYPNIWFIDDHGGSHPYTLEDKNQKKIKI